MEHQLRAWGLPQGSKRKNVERAGGLEFLRQRRASGKRADLTSKDGSWGYAALNIPELDYYVLMHRFPDLNSKDHEIKRKAWMKFCQDPASLPYRVTEDVGRRRPASRIVVR